MPFDDFMRLALYDPGVGYYRQAHARVGYGAGTDFFTASTSDAVFGELIAAACVSLLGGRPALEFAFVEIGAEPGGGVLRNVSHPFSANQILRAGDTLALSGACIVFSNELFDAQPFRRFVFRAGHWRELGVACRDGCLHECEIDRPAPTSFLPSDAPEGYHFDAPLASVQLLEDLADQPWHGLFLAFDYGKTWTELAASCPAGTARAYHRHTQSNDLLARPGEQDLTCHVCWDWLSQALTRHGFASPALVSQESFLVNHASSYLAQAARDEASRFSRKKLSLLQLLHPAHLGLKFQVLHATRGL